MSYGPPRTSTPYGDQDFIKEDQDPPQAMASPRYSIGPAASTTTTTSSDFGGYPSDTQHAQPVKAVVGESGTAAQSQAPPLVMRNLREAEELIKSITPEDRLFLQAWRQDSFYYRSKYDHSTKPMLNLPTISINTNLEIIMLQSCHSHLFAGRLITTITSPRDFRRIE